MDPKELFSLPEVLDLDEKDASGDALFGLEEEDFPSAIELAIMSPSKERTRRLVTRPAPPPHISTPKPKTAARRRILPRRESIEFSGIWRRTGDASSIASRTCARRLIHGRSPIMSVRDLLDHDRKRTPLSSRKVISIDSPSMNAVVGKENGVTPRKTLPPQPPRIKTPHSSRKMHTALTPKKRV
eukprot:TRINITY_DN80518_c0_g1_i1.p1 TRINITY_DN80518_c0_g1~~TRINITY_DN80518_c0_g1_i1.p1  ORF type:complete len:213 (+),score=64.40 TRINITY_DN80518_c0_g1_i1:87-641(+)